MLQEHEPEVGLDRDRGTTEQGVEVGPERLEEGLVVEQPVDSCQDVVPFAVEVQRWSQLIQAAA